MQVTLIPTGHSLNKVVNTLGAKMFPYLVNGVRKAANMVMREWIKRVNDSSAKEGFKRAYSDSIHLEPGANELSASVVAEGMQVGFVEDGIKRFDMKPGLLNSPKAKTNKKGEPYMIVSFRHGAPGTKHIPNMPREIHKAMQTIKGQSLIQSRIRTIPGLETMDIPGKYKGMVRMGKRGHEQYRTFRVVTSKSKGWWYPGISKVPIFDRMSNDMKSKVKETMQDGLIKDLNTTGEGMTK